MQKAGEDTLDFRKIWCARIPVRAELEMEDSGTEIRMKGFWRRSLNPDTSLDLLPCGLPVIRLPLTLPPGKHHSHPRPSHHLPTRLSPPSLILRSFSTPSHPHKLLHLFTWLLISDMSGWELLCSCEPKKSCKQLQTLTAQRNRALLEKQGGRRHLGSSYLGGWDLELHKIY